MHGLYSGDMLSRRRMDVTDSEPLNPASIPSFLRKYKTGPKSSEAERALRRVRQLRGSFALTVQLQTEQHCRVKLTLTD